MVLFVGIENIMMDLRYSKRANTRRRDISKSTLIERPVHLAPRCVFQDFRSTNSQTLDPEVADGGREAMEDLSHDNVE